MVAFTFWVILKRRPGGRQTGVDSLPRPLGPQADKNKRIKKPIGERRQFQTQQEPVQQGEAPAEQEGIDGCCCAALLLLCCSAAAAAGAQEKNRISG